MRLFNRAVKPYCHQCQQGATFPLPVPFLNGSKRLHSQAIQLVHHNRASAVRRSADSISRWAGRSSKGVHVMRIIGKRTLLKIVALTAAGTALSGCVYDVGLGYASDGYYNDYYCDPYGGYDSYYDCDYRSGFYNIGFGGGWYDNYYYPGYGYYLFDNYGRRHAMRDNHRRYWGEKRHGWYREHRGRDRDRKDYRGRGRGYSDSATPGVIGWPERDGGRVRDGDGRRRGDGQGRRGRNDQWRGGDGNGAAAVPTPNPDYVRGRGDGRRGDGQGRGRWRGNDGANAVPQPNRAERRGNGGQGNAGQRNWRQPAPQPSSGQGDAAAVRPAPPPRSEGPRREAPRHRASEGGTERPD
jgi:hypothetical protein